MILIIVAFIAFVFVTGSIIHWIKSEREYRKWKNGKWPR